MTRNLFYSNYYSIKSKKHIIKKDFIINAHYNKFYKIKKNTQTFLNTYNSLQLKDMTLENTYYLYFDESHNDPLEKLCVIFRNYNYDCKRIEKIHVEGLKENLHFLNEQYKMTLYYLN